MLYPTALCGIVLGMLSHRPMAITIIIITINNIVKSDWLSTALISALIGQFNRTVLVMSK